MDEIYHHIEKYILQTLGLAKSRRFAQMRPPRTESNLYAYHLTKLIKLGYIEKQGLEYSLSPKGLAYVDKLSFSHHKFRQQPKINTGIIIQNEFGEVLLTKRRRQPLIEKWGLPMGKLHESDTSIFTAAEREVWEKTGLKIRKLEHVGDTYWRFYLDDQLISSILAHLFITRIKKSDCQLDDQIRWVSAKDLIDHEIIPGVARIVKLALGAKAHFLAEMKFKL
jgi:8-oxo-dGTP pyrophosphatase MutT (NUDIX family)